jgi:putative DeoR family transcriptional regulator (stage III sporulation protein D)
MAHFTIAFGDGSADDRAQILARHIVSSGDTVRATALRFGLSKSTVHKDVTERLAKIDPTLFSSVRDVLEKNKSERHIRGGDATRLMYLCKKCQNIQEYSSKNTSPK